MYIFRRELWDKDCKRVWDDVNPYDREVDEFGNPHWSYRIDGLEATVEKTAPYGIVDDLIVKREWCEEVKDGE